MDTPSNRVILTCILIYFKLAFVYEAASGNHKFGRGAIQRSNYMLSWLKKPAIEDFVVKVNPIKDRNSPTIKKYAEQMDVQVNWKSSSTRTKSHLGYNVYQNVRIGLGQLFTESQQIYENYSKTNRIPKPTTFSNHNKNSHKTKMFTKYQLLKVKV